MTDIRFDFDDDSEPTEHGAWLALVALVIGMAAVAAFAIVAAHWGA